jgi:hypothetical protein
LAGNKEIFPLSRKAAKKTKRFYVNVFEFWAKPSAGMKMTPGRLKTRTDNEKMPSDTANRNVSEKKQINGKGK